jgi:UDP-2,4-diacetamido-2,4,6-trideoxy-beta-L-altropyranose hydrolase
LLPEDCTLLAGPAHVLLRPEFDRSSLRERTGIIENVMVYFGGNDRTNQAGKVIASLQSFPHLNVEVILGMNHPFKEFAHLAVRNNPRFRIFERCDDIARSMLNADLGIGVCGMAAWERCALGLPALVTISAENQKEDACALNDLGAVLLLGRSENIDHLQWTEALELVLNNPLRVKKMSEAATAVVAGHAENRLKLIQRMIGYAS